MHWIQLMDLRLCNQVLYLISIIICMLSAVILIIGFIMPFKIDIKNKRSISNNNFDKLDITQSETHKIPNLKDFRKVWSIPLQRPLIDPPVAKETKENPKPRLDLKLLGLIYEPGEERAIISINNNSNRMVSIGDVFFEGDYRIEIKSITEDDLTVDYCGDLLITPLK